MNTNDYINERLKQLNNKENYQKLSTDPTEKFSSDVREVLDLMLNEELIDIDTYGYLNIKSAKLGRFYMLPKIHKKGIHGRPICSSNNHPTERISEFMDHHMRKYVTTLPSLYIRDTQQFIKRVLGLGEMPEGLTVKMNFFNGRASLFHRIIYGGSSVFPQSSDEEVR